MRQQLRAPRVVAAVPVHGGFVVPPPYYTRGVLMNFQGVVMNVADLDRSIDFYRDVLGYTLLSREQQLAAIGIAENDRTQAIVLRAIGRG